MHRPKGGAKCAYIYVYGTDLDACPLLNLHGRQADTGAEGAEELAMETDQSAGTKLQDLPPQLLGAIVQCLSETGACSDLLALLLATTWLREAIEGHATRLEMRMEGMQDAGSEGASQEQQEAGGQGAGPA